MHSSSLTVLLRSPCWRTTSQAVLPPNGDNMCCSTQAGDVWGQYLAAQSRKKAAAAVGRRQAPPSMRNGTVNNPGKVFYGLSELKQSSA